MIDKLLYLMKVLQSVGLIIIFLPTKKNIPISEIASIHFKFYLSSLLKFPSSLISVSATSLYSPIQFYPYIFISHFTVPPRSHLLLPTSLVTTHFPFFLHHFSYCLFNYLHPSSYPLFKRDPLK